MQQFALFVVLQHISVKGYGLYVNPLCMLRKMDDFLYWLLVYLILEPFGLLLYFILPAWNAYSETYKTFFMYKKLE